MWHTDIEQSVSVSTLYCIKFSENSKVHMCICIYTYTYTYSMLLYFLTYFLFANAPHISFLYVVHLVLLVMAWLLPSSQPSAPAVRTSSCRAGTSSDAFAARPGDVPQQWWCRWSCYHLKTEWIDRMEWHLVLFSNDRYVTPFCNDI